LTDLVAGELVYISPSQFEKFLQCPLHWFMSSHGARDGSFEANLGTLIHKALETLDDVSESALMQAVESKWHQLEFESAWLEDVQRRKARKIITNLANYLKKQQEAGIEVVAVEQQITGVLDRAKISGTIDRIERTSTGEITIVDLKTGKAHTSKSKADENAQLALYQLAFENGGAVLIPGISESDRLAGARLLFPLVDEIHEQKSLADQTNTELAEIWKARIADAIEGMAMTNGLLVAEINSHCNSDYSYGDCKLFLTEAVSYSG
jgi:RecB family exonuclease